MRAIYCVLLGFVLYYIASHMNNDEHKVLCGVFVLCSFLSLITSIILMIVGI